MSMMRMAVLAPSSVTALSSGGGGGFTFAQSSRISAAEAQVANARMRTAAAAAAPRNRFRIFNMYLLSSLIVASRVYCRSSMAILYRLVTFGSSFWNLGDANLIQKHRTRGFWQFRLRSVIYGSGATGSSAGGHSDTCWTYCVE